MSIKEMPEEWLNLLTLAILVQLDNDAMDTELDVVTGLMMECLQTLEQGMWVK
jgi:hypothetical protein